ncbi:hypothetical protein GE061_014653 [Apolygus lucorum]|uniref:Uncharacterized protein n=1 Tax=Apolygus lucorum TaxID=248454 RepID=A0A8S9XKV6_APOLU|nr:hypothetical protein GE061_014653 [Apolygus lucorum]
MNTEVALVQHLVLRQRIPSRAERKRSGWKRSTPDDTRKAGKTPDESTRGGAFIRKFALTTTMRGDSA